MGQSKLQETGFQAADAGRDGFGYYMKDVGRYDLLTPEGELRVSRAIQNGEEEALERLVQANLRFVISFAKRFTGRGVPLEDLVQEGNVGLMKAARTFDPERGNRFLTHARYWVRAQMLRIIEKQGRTVRLPASQLRKIRRVYQARAELELRHGAPPNPEQIAQAAEMPLAIVCDALRTAQASVAMDMPTSEEDDGEPLYSILPDPDELDMDEHIDDAARSNKIDEAMASLPERRRRIIEMYYGLHSEETLTLQEIADQMGLTRERIRQLRNDGLRRIRERLGSEMKFS